jgi:hypothetical protein
MKKPSYKILFITLLLVAVFTGCNEELLDELLDRKGVAKKTRLKEMTRDGRRYQFAYDNKGHVDYITAVEGGQTIYTYDVTYKRKKLFLVQLVEQGNVVSENSNFEFDESGNIIEYTYTQYIEGVPEGVSTVNNLQYDDQNRLIFLTSDGSPSGREWIYDNEDNVTRSTTSGSETTYTYDNKRNPLNMVPDLFFLVVEETGYWEFIVSKHNSVTRSHFTSWNNQTVNTTYTNEYDQYSRLVRKTEDSGNEFTFTYD